MIPHFDEAEHLGVLDRVFHHGVETGDVGDEFHGVAEGGLTPAENLGGQAALEPVQAEVLDGRCGSRVDVDEAPEEGVEVPNGDDVADGVEQGGALAARVQKEAVDHAIPT